MGNGPHRRKHIVTQILYNIVQVADGIWAVRKPGTDEQVGRVRQTKNDWNHDAYLWDALDRNGIAFVSGLESNLAVALGEALKHVINTH